MNTTGKIVGRGLIILPLLAGLACYTHQVVGNALAMVRESRAFGLNFVTLGQSWSHKEMDTSFREQHRTTAHFGTNNPASSRMMLNRPDAVNITVPGRAYFTLPFGLARDVVEIQTPFLDPTTALRLLPAATDQPVSFPDRLNNSKEIGLAEKRVKILELWDQGIRVIKTICEQVYGPGHTGGKYYQMVEKVLREYGRI